MPFQLVATSCNLRVSSSPSAARAHREIEDQGELLRRVTVVQSCCSARHRIEKRTDFLLDPFPVWLDDHSPPVAGIPPPPREPGLFQAIDHARDGTSGEPGSPGQFARGYRPASRQDSRTLVVGDVHPESVGDRLMEKDRHGADLAHFLHQQGDQLGLVARFS